MKCSGRVLFKMKMPDSAWEVRHWKVFRLSAKLQFLEDRGVAIEVGALEIVEELTAASGHSDEAAARVEVLAVVAKVLGEVLNAGCEKRDLHFARAGVLLVGTEFLDDCCFVDCGVAYWF